MLARPEGMGPVVAPSALELGAWGVALAIGGAGFTATGSEFFAALAFVAAGVSGVRVTWAAWR